MNQPIFYRVASCKILGQVAVHPKLQPTEYVKLYYNYSLFLLFICFSVKRDILPITQSLCQDCNHEIRAAICAQLARVAEGLGNLFLKANLLPGLVELAADENVAVRAAAVQTVVQILPLLTTGIV